MTSAQMLLGLSLLLAVVPVIPLQSVSQPKRNHTLLHAPGVPKISESEELPFGLEKDGFVHAFIAALSLIIVSELGDKTFFIAAILAMRNPRVVVFAGAMTSLAMMHVLSALLGFAVQVIPRWFTFYLSTVLFAVFGAKMLKDGVEMSPDGAMEEMDEVQSDLKRHEELEEQMASSVTVDPETGVVSRSAGASPAQRVRLGVSRLLRRFCSPIFLQSFVMTTLAEWGDRSQLTTVILAARENVIGVILGGACGHFLCTGLAVVGGRLIAQRISVRTVTICGGITFLVFAVSAFFIGP